MKTINKILLGMILTIVAIAIILNFLFPLIVLFLYPSQLPSSQHSSEVITINYTEPFLINKNYTFYPGENFTYITTEYTKGIVYDIITGKYYEKEESEIYKTEYEYFLINETKTSDRKKFFTIINEKNVPLIAEGIGIKFTRNQTIRNVYNFTEDGDCQGDCSEVYRSESGFFINKWMLNLEENKSFTIEITKNFENRTFREIQNFAVLGIESVNGKECYKVKIDIIHYNKRSPTYSRLIYWIDKERRILVKMEEWKGDFKHLEKILLV